jgi:hypothetical protein
MLLGVHFFPDLTLFETDRDMCTLATVVTTEKTWFDSRYRQRILLLSKTPDRFWDPLSLLLCWY